MKNVKVFLIGMLMVAFSSFSFAQEKNTPEERAKIQTDKLKEKLLLSEDQINKVYEINLGIDRQNESLRGNTSLSVDEKKQSLAANNEARKEKIKQVLNPEQLKKFESMEAKRAERMEAKPLDKKVKEIKM
jgi:hypothetical protein